MTPHNRLRIGRRLRDVREAYRLTRQDVAARLDRCERTIRRWESGATLPTLPELAALAGVYGCDWLVLLPGRAT